MKKFLIATLAAVIAAGPVLAAPYQNDRQGQSAQAHRDNRDDRAQDRRTVVVKKTVVRRSGPVQARRWAKGQRFESRYAQNYRVIQSPRQYRLRDAPRGYRWVQSGNDAVLIAIATGIIAAVTTNAIR